MRDRRPSCKLGSFAAMAVALTALAPAALAQAPVPASAPALGGVAQKDETPGLLATQLTLVVQRDRTSRRFRGTVVRVDGDRMAILTAAHCLSDADEGGPIIVAFAEGVGVEGTVESVTRNPLYRPNQSREIPGPDNALAWLRFADAGKLAGPAGEAFRRIKAAPAMSTRFYPGPSGQVVEVRMVDARNVEHAVKASNHSNPRWLEWGRLYQPIPGDSGGGVFVVRPGADGTPRPILIGVIVGHDVRGGGASLIAVDQPWLAKELPL